MGTGVVARHWGVSTGVGAHQASRDLRQMAAAAMVGGTVSASTRRASKTSAPPSSHSVKTTGRAAAPAPAAVAIYPANTVLLPAEGYPTGQW